LRSFKIARTIGPENKIGLSFAVIEQHPVRAGIEIDLNRSFTFVLKVKIYR
jgi:hypothetical protein